MLNLVRAFSQMLYFVMLRFFGGIKEKFPIRRVNVIYLILPICIQQNILHLVALSAFAVCSVYSVSF